MSLRRIGRTWQTLSVLAFASAVMLVTPAAADWLVTRDGAELEVKGRWTVRGASVVFTLLNGTLSSMRLAEVDLRRSAETTHQAQSPLPDAGALDVPQEPVLELTNENIQRAKPLPTPVSDVATAMRSAGAPAGVTINQPYGLFNWTLVPRGNGIEIRGSLIYNGDDDSVDRLEMIVGLRTVDGVSFAETRARLTAPMLRRGAGTTFRAVFATVEAEDFRVDVHVSTREGRRR